MVSRARIIVLVACLLLCGGCAAFNRDNTPALNFVENRMLPEEGAPRYVAYPLLLPVALAAVAMDAVIIHPISVAHDAYLDTKEALWERLDWQHQYVTECFSLVPRTLATPIVLAGCFLGRSTFDIEPRGGRPRLRERQPPPSEARPAQPPEKKPDQQLLAQAKTALDNERYDEAKALVDKACVGVTHLTDEVFGIRAAVLLGRGDFDSFHRLADRRPPLVTEKVVDREIARALRKGTPVEQMKLLVRWGPVLAVAAPAETVTALDGLLGAQDRAVAMRALEILGNNSGDRRIQSILQRVAQGQDPVLAAAAQSYLK